MARRRDLLASLGTAASVLAGCAGPRGTDSSGAATPTPEEHTTAGTRLAQQGIPSDICSEPIQDDPGIYAIVEPAFAEDWSDIDPDTIYRFDDDTSGLVPEQTVIGLTDGDRARAYPIELLWRHEIVNDDFGGPVAVTYCPLCRSGVVADRVLRGESTRFLVSGLLWKPPGLEAAASAQSNRTFGADRTGGGTEITRAGNLVLYDELTESYWSQLLATAICGPLREQRLAIRPSTVTTWASWREQQPETDVLLPPPYSRSTRPDEHPETT